ncbi:MAG: lycopene cyclase domain-containing protein [Trueperaceae bacterium]|nr:lycopene cyclase domain-containing protein [Trueperaceae bacterium]MDZ7799633.1 lycopene cyclase domain-containing protein [Trueperaceae bacterium]
MTYLQFHLVFLLPPIVALFLLTRRRLRGTALGASRVVTAFAAIVVLALAYTTPWDNALVARGVWGYPDGRVLFTLGYVPIEEYAFFVLQPILTGLALLVLAGPGPLAPRARPAPCAALWRVLGASGFLALGGVGAALLTTQAGTYLGMILAWAGPVGALQWAVGGHELAARGRSWLPAVAVSTLYLWAADRAALALGIWWISPELTTGVHLLGLPVEEATFFLVTNLMVVQGLVLFLAMVPRREWRWAY